MQAPGVRCKDQEGDARVRSEVQAPEVRCKHQEGDASEREGQMLGDLEIKIDLAFLPHFPEVCAL